MADGSPSAASAAKVQPPLPAHLRQVSVLAAASCALPMLLHVPRPLAAGLLLVLAIGLYSRGRWPGWLRALLTLTLVGAVLGSFGFKLGRDAASSLLLAMLALKTLELATRRDCQSLIGFSLFAPFAAFLQDQGPLTLLLSLPALLAVVIGLQQLAEADVGSAPAPRSQLRAGAFMLLLALPLAATGFWLFPRLASPLWGMPENAGARTGMNDRMSPGDWLDLMNDDTPAFRVRFFGAVPALEEMYWRGPVLSHFDGRSWTQAYWTASLPMPEVEAAERNWRYEVTLDPTDRRYLFALDLPQTLSVAARIGQGMNAETRTPIDRILRYEASSAPPARFEAELRPTLRQTALQLPDGFNPRTRALAAQWRAEGADDAEIVRRALAWINRDFTYSLETSLLGRHSVDEFLFDVRIGFCEHFSSAFAVLMRAAGIPARVVTGYAGGYRNPLGDFWLVRQSDAHAWTEIWLPERGWVRIDPTAAVAPERIFQRAAQAGGLAALDGVRQALDIGDWARWGWNDLLLQFNAARQRSLLRPLGIDEADSLQLGMAFAVGAGLALALTLWLLLRGQRERLDPVLAAWYRFERRAARAGWPRRPDEPATRYGQRLAQALPDQAGQIDSLSRRFANWRYAPAALDEAGRQALIQDLRGWRPR